MREVITVSLRSIVPRCVSKAPEKLAGMVNGSWYLSIDR